MGFHSILPPQPKRPVSELRWGGRWQGLSSVLALSFGFTTILLIGAVFQTILVLVLPKPYALVPAVAVLLLRGLDTAAITFGIRRNPYIANVIHKKSTAIVPDADGEFGDQGEANENIVVLMLGAKSNHPLNAFAPHFNTLNDYVMKMAEDFDTNAPKNGFLGQTGWMKTDKNGCMQFNLISYWRSIDDIHIFAHADLHREAWAWWDKMFKEGLVDHLGINHEIFAAPRSQWESVYANFQPTGLGATTYLRRGDKLEGGVVDDAWISPLVEANKGKLRTSAGRLGWGPATQHDKYGLNVYD